MHHEACTLHTSCVHHACIIYAACIAACMSSSVIYTRVCFLFFLARRCLWALPLCTTPLELGFAVPDFSFDFGSFVWPVALLWAHWDALQHNIAMESAASMFGHNDHHRAAAHPSTQPLPITITPHPHRHRTIHIGTGISSFEVPLCRMGSNVSFVLRPNTLSPTKQKRQRCSNR